MSADEINPKQEHRSFRLTLGRALSVRERIARDAIIIYFFILLAACFMLCSCPGLYALMTVPATVAIILGSRFQRIVSVCLLIAAIGGFFIQLEQEQQQKQRMNERIRHIKELKKQSGQNQ